VGADPADGLAAQAVAVARRGARRRNVPEPKARVFRSVVKMTAAEKSFVDALASAQRVSVPALFMRAVFTGGTDAAAGYERLREELVGARRSLAALGANVNQLTRQANARALGDEVPAVTIEQLGAVAAAVQHAVERVDSITARASLTAPDRDDR